MRELAQLPVRIGGAQAFFGVQEHSQFTRIGRRCEVKFLRIDRDPHAIPVLQS